MFKEFKEDTKSSMKLMENNLKRINPWKPKNKADRNDEVLIEFSCPIVILK